MLASGVHLKLVQFQNTSDGTDIEAEQHASKAGRAGHGEGTPSVNLRRICLDGIVLDDASDNLRAGADASTHDCGLRCCSTLVLWSPADDAPWSSADRWYQLRVGERMTSTDWMISQSGTVRIYITAHTAVQAPCQDGVTNAAVLTPGP